MTTTEKTYRYAIQYDSGAAYDATEREAEEARIAEWSTAIDLPDGTEFAAGRSDDERKVKVYRIAE